MIVASKLAPKMTTKQEENLYSLLLAVFRVEVLILHLLNMHQVKFRKDIKKNFLEKCKQSLYKCLIL